MDFQFIENHFKEHYRKYYKIAQFRCGNEWDAEDILQDAYENALRYCGSYSGEDFDAWFYRILTNALKDFRNASKGNQTVPLEDVEEESIPDYHLGEQVLQEIHQLIKAKSPVLKEVLTLHFKYNYSAIDISRITDYSYSNCHQIIRRFSKEIKDKYG